MRQHQSHETVLPSIVSVTANTLVSELESCDQQKAVNMLETDSLHATADILQHESFMLSLDNQNSDSKDVTKLQQQFRKSEDISTHPESVTRSKELKEGRLVSAYERDTAEPVLLYVPNSSLREGNDDSLRNAEILASFNQGAPILVTGRCSQYITLPTDQSLVEQLAATLQPGITYQYVLSSPLGNEATFMQTASDSESELAPHVDTTVHMPSIISLHMEKHSAVEEKK
jgi:hypothetical protein